MAKKKDEAAEETAKKQDTVKAIDGTEVAISPKQREMLDAIVERSASGSPVGSDGPGADFAYLEKDSGRLDDPSSIAAMKLATGEHPVVLRAKFGVRWHYFRNTKDMEAAQKAAEKAAADEKATKAAAKAAKAKPADDKADEGGGKTTNAAAGKGGGRLKKPSEK